MKGKTIKDLSITQIVLCAVILAILSVPVHETGHYLAYRLFGFEVEELKFITFEKKVGNEYTFGYVQIIQNEHNSQLNAQYGDSMELINSIVALSGGLFVALIGIIADKQYPAIGFFLIWGGISSAIAEWFMVCV